MKSQCDSLLVKCQAQEEGINMDIKKRIEELRNTVEYHNDRYYNQDDPEISDYEYDQLSLELRRLEKEHPEFDGGVVKANDLEERKGLGMTSKVPRWAAAIYGNKKHVLSVA